MLEIHSAIFDMDGTLVDSLMLWDVLAEAMAVRYPEKKDVVINAEDACLIPVLPLPEAMTLLHAHYGIGACGDELTTLAQAVFLDFYSNRVQLKEGVGEFLETLQTQGIPMCIVSATPLPLIEAALDHCGIRHYFSRVFSCGEIGKGKDNPAIYLKAKEFLGNRPGTWVFEDAYTAVSTAVSIGFPTVAVYDRYNPHQEEIRAMATHYIAPGETLLKLL